MINLNEEGTFLAGRWALSTFINDNIADFTIRTLEGEDFVVKEEELKPFGSPTTISTPAHLSTVTDNTTTTNDATLADGTVTDATDIAPTEIIVFQAFWKGSALSGYLSQKNPAVLADLEVDGETTKVLSGDFKPLLDPALLKHFAGLYGHEVAEDKLEE